MPLAKHSRCQTGVTNAWRSTQQDSGATLLPAPVISRKPLVQKNPPRQMKVAASPLKSRPKSAVTRSAISSRRSSAARPHSAASHRTVSSTPSKSSRISSARIRPGSALSSRRSSGCRSFCPPSQLSNSRPQSAHSSQEHDRQVIDMQVSSDQGPITVSHLAISDDEDEVIKIKDPGAEEAPRIVKLIRDRCQFRSIANMYRNLNDDPDGEISQEELRTGFERLGFELKPSEFKQLWDYVDTDLSGGISMQELLEAFTLEGSMGGVGAGLGEDGGGDTIHTTEYDQMVEMINTRAGLREDVERDTVMYKEITARELAAVLRDRAEARSSFHEFFRTMDKDGTGRLDKTEVKEMLDRMCFKIEEVELEKLFRLCDQEHADGEIDYSEFTNSLIKATPVELDQALGKKKLKRISFGRTDGLSEEDALAAADLRHQLSLDHHLVGRLASADTNSDGIITKTEFVDMIVKQNAVHPETHSRSAAEALWSVADQFERGSLDLRHMITAIKDGLPRPTSTQEQVKEFSLGMRESSRPHSALECRSTQASFYNPKPEDPSGIHKKCAYEPGELRGRFARTPFRDTNHVVQPQRSLFSPWKETVSRDRTSSGDRLVSQKVDAKKRSRRREQRVHRNKHNQRQMCNFTGHLTQKAEALAEGRIHSKSVQKMKYFKSLSGHERISERMRDKLNAQLDRAKELANAMKSNAHDISIGPYPNFGSIIISPEQWKSSSICAD